jgi:phage tail sheath protein FI
LLTQPFGLTTEEITMASTELLASKVVILEEEPNIPAISALPSAVLLVLGITERGPIADRTLTTSFDEYKKTYGGFTLDSQVAIAVHGFFTQGGSFAWISRTVHFTDITDKLTFTATKGSVMLQNDGTAASPAIVGPGSAVEPFAMDPNDHIDIDAGAGSVAATFLATPGTLTDTAVYPIAALAGGETFGLTLDNENGGREQTITAVGGEANAVDIANLINDQIVGGKAEVSGGQVLVTTDRQGTDAGIQVTTEGTLNPILGFPTSKSAGTGNVADIFNVTALEVEAVVEAAHAAPNDVDVIIGLTGTIQIQTATAEGATASIQVLVTSTVDFGLDNDVHNGSDATPEDTLFVEAKTPGAFSDDITTAVENATSGTAEQFNFKVLKNGVVSETYPNVSMDATSLDYIEARVNDPVYGSDLIVVQDQLLPYSALLKRPALGASANMTGGDDGLVGIADSDYIGNEAGETGLYAFNKVNGGRLLIVPGIYTPAVHKAMLDYAEIFRNGSMFCVLDCPPQQTAQQVVTYVETTAALLEYSEYGAIYWPWLKVSNPQPSVFGTSEAITVPPSGWVTGKYASNDQRIGGIYESPAGIGGGYGVMRGVLGVEDDPDGGSIHQVEDEGKRDLVYPKRINPITRLPGTPWHIDGGRTLKSIGSFPNVAERRGVIFIEQTIANSMIQFKHRPNNKTTRRQAGRIVTIFLTQEMNKGAFRSLNTEEAFFVDVSDQLNPTANEFAGILTMRIGLATNKPAEYIVVLVTQDTRALEESLAA